MSQLLLTIRMDEDLKSEFDHTCKELGLTMSAAITIFAKTVCREQCIPFQISLKGAGDWSPELPLSCSSDPS